MNTNNCSAPTMDGYSSAVYWACAVSCAVHIVSIACLIFQNFSLFQHYKKHALGQMVLHILFSLIVSVFVHPMHFESLGRFQPAGILSMLGVSGMDQFNVLVFLVLVTSLALVEESNLWFRLIVSDSFSDRFFSKLMKIGRWVNRLTCLFFLLISCFMQALQRSTYFIEETCPFSFSLNFGSVSVWITLAICLVAAGSFCGTFISSIWLAKSELVDSFRFRQSRPNYNILLHSLIIRTIITLFSFFAAPQFFTHFSSSECMFREKFYATEKYSDVPVIPKLLLANHGTLLTIISIISMVRVKSSRNIVGVFVTGDANSNSVHSIRV
ncbi:unnamed protein product [Caenorhabditis brenneri]